MSAMEKPRKILVSIAVTWLPKSPLSSTNIPAASALLRNSWNADDRIGFEHDRHRHRLPSSAFKDASSGLAGRPLSVANQ